MTEREQLETQIRELLTADLDAVTVSNRLFGPESGLFVRLGTTVEERRAIIQSELWKSAQARVRELEARDLVRFREVVHKVEEHQPAGTYSLRVGSTESLPTT